MDRLLNVEELANLAVLEGRPEVARQLFEHAAGWGDVATTARFLREWAKFEGREGNVSEARALFRRAADRCAIDIRTWLAWALLERREGEYEECMRLLREVRLALLITSVLRLLHAASAMRCAGDPAHPPWHATQRQMEPMPK